MWHGDVSWWSWALMTVGMVAFWAFVVWAIVVLARRDDRRDVPAPEKPEDIVAARFARGEIDEATYWRTTEALRGRPSERSGASSDPDVRLTGSG